MSNLQIGSLAIDRPYGVGGTATHIVKDGTSLRTGKIKKIEIYASEWGGRTVLKNCEVATFYRPDAENYPNNFTTRDNEAIGDVAVGSKQSFNVDLDVEVGDYIGIFIDDGENSAIIDGDNIGYSGRWVLTTDVIPCTNQLFSFVSSKTISLAGVGLTVTVQDSTDISTTTITANGNITAIGDANATRRGFKYGLTKTATWDVHDDGDYGTGAYTKAITEHLTANTFYWVQAYAVDPDGTSYSEWVQFQTSATGEVPSGTRISICSDNSGYTYKLNKSLTDDGDSYVSYFVLSTDLAQKQGLHIKKWLQDIFSYFAKEDSGTCKIYIKQDNEASWQYAGEVSLMGDEDIVIPHLPVDYEAKHYLIKFVFENDFEYIGNIFEFIPTGER